MFYNFLRYTISFILFGLIAHAQEISSFTYHGHIVIPNDQEVSGKIIGGLSGITYNSNDSSFYLVADKPPARMYKIIIPNDGIEGIRLVEVLLLSPALVAKSELEGIAHNYKTDNFYVSDEQKSGTRILELNSEAKFIRIIEPANQAFIPLSGHNSGIEGLTLSDDLKAIFFAFERPTDDCLERSLVRITRKNLTDLASQVTFNYQLHYVANDRLNTNGISDVLFLNDSSLLVMERAYIPNQGNVVRLFKADLEVRASSEMETNCNNDSIVVLKSRLLFDFEELSGLKIDNAEGMTFNADRSLLYIVTDNNFSSKQQTQIIVLKVNKKRNHKR